MICGHEPDTDEHREADYHPETGCLYCATGEAAGRETWLRPVRRIHSQPSLPDCTGEAIAACIEAQAGGAVSGRDLWAEGLRRCGRAPSLDTGLAFVPALIGLERRGWCAYHDGEELALPPAKPSLEDELDAADSAGHIVTRYRIPAGASLPNVLADALLGELDAVIGLRVTDDYQAHRPPKGQLSIVGPEMVGPKGDPHAQRVVGFVVVGGQRVWVLQNSWTAEWGGALVNGVWVRGCALVSEASILSAYDCHVIGVRRE